MSTKLTVDEKEALGDFMTSEAWPALLKLVDELVENIDSNVMKYNLNQGDRGLTIEKARSEGAHQLSIAIKAIKNKRKGN
jgi:hypothetical protein